MKLSSILAALAAVAGASEAAAQEEIRVVEVESSGAVLLRFSGITGELDSGLGLDYGDLWGAGVGLSFETDLMFPLQKGWSIGLYVSAGFDVFEGETDTDDVGDTLEADSLLTSHVLFGFKAMLFPDRGGFFLDGRLGLGPVFWSETEGELTIAGTPIGVTLIDSSATLGFEFAAHAGFSLRRVYFAAGFAVRGQGTPEEADLDFEGTESAVVGSFEVEVGFRF